MLRRRAHLLLTIRRAKVPTYSPIPRIGRRPGRLISREVNRHSASLPLNSHRPIVNQQARAWPAARRGCVFRACASGTAADSTSRGSLVLLIGKGSSAVAPVPHRANGGRARSSCRRGGVNESRRLGGDNTLGRFLARRGQPWSDARRTAAGVRAPRPLCRSGRR
jgi:hypothetical protein